MALGILSIVFIAVAGGLALFFVAYVSVTLVIWRKHKAQLADLERKLIAKETSHEVQVTQPPLAARRDTQAPQNARVGWGILSSNEDLRHDFAQGAIQRVAKRKSSDMLSWPLPRRRSRRAIAAKESQSVRLSTVQESPKAKHVLDGLEDSLLDPPVRGKTHRGPFHFTKSTASQSQWPTRSPSGSPPSDVAPSEALMPRPLVIRRPSDAFPSLETTPLRKRSVSVPVISYPHQIEQLDIMKRAVQHRSAGSRSNSVGHTGPTQPLPPLPASAQDDRGHQNLGRSFSNESLTSGVSVSSTLLKKSSSSGMKARDSFSQRHPDMGLVPQIRPGDTGMKEALISSPHNTHASTQARENPPRTSSRAPAPMMSPHVGEEKSPASVAPSAFMARLRAAGGLEHTPPTRGDEFPPRSTSRKSPAQPQKSPTKDQLVRRVSDSFGSPVGKIRRRPAPLQAISGNMPPRQNSETTSSRSSASSVSQGNPFQWDSPQPINRSALKGSPNARKTHKRQNVVRISITPTVFGNSRSQSRSSSTQRMVDIAEEQADMPSSPPELKAPRPPSVATFEPLLRRPISSQPSMTDGSPSLLLDEFLDNSAASRYLGTGQGSPEDGESKASSIVAIPSFPIHSSPLEEQPSTDSSKDDLRWPPVYGLAISSPASSQQAIPGLSLLQQRSPTEFQFPTINVVSGPTSPAPPSHSSPSALKNRSPKVRAETKSPARAPWNLSPSPKSMPTTQVSQDLPPIPALRVTPRSSTVNPLDTKPDFPPPSEAIEASPHVLPVATRNMPRDSLLYHVVGLRRDNSDAVRHSPTSRETRRYLNMAQSGSPDLSGSPELGGYERSLDWTVRDAIAEEKENRPQSTSTMGDDGDDFWKSDMGNAKNRLQTIVTVPSKRGKRVAFGGVEYRESAFIANTPTSLYDKDGFLVGEEF